jgi:hypothetical protein
MDHNASTDPFDLDPQITASVSQARRDTDDCAGSGDCSSTCGHTDGCLR